MDSVFSLRGRLVWRGFGDNHDKLALPDHIHMINAVYALNCCRKAFFQGQAIHRFAFERIIKKLQGIT